MKVNELKDRTQIDELVLEITSMEEPRDVRGGTLKVCNCQGKDDTGTVAVTLWNEDIDKVKEGDTIKITDGWASIFNNTLQVSPGRRGKLEVIDG